MRKLLFVVFVVLACSPPTGVPDDFEPFEPPLVYRDWYAQVEACAERTGDFGRIRWYLVPGTGWYSERHGTYVNGLWTSGHKIYVAESYVFYEPLIKEEMVHDLGFNHDAEGEVVLERCVYSTR